MATGNTIAEKNGALNCSKNQESYEMDTLRIRTKVKQVIRQISPDNIDTVHSKLKKCLRASSPNRLEDVVRCIYDEAINFPLAQDGNYPVELVAKLCKSCADIEASTSQDNVLQIITFQDILIKIILSEYVLMSKQPSSEKKLLNWLKNFKGPEDKKLAWIHANSAKMQKNENKRALGSMNFVIELFIVEVVNIETLHKIVQFTIMRASLTSVIECLHAVLSYINIDFKVLKWEDDSKYELLSGVLEKMSELLQASSTSHYTERMVKHLLDIWPKEQIKEFGVRNERKIQLLNPFNEVTLCRIENPWRPRRITVQFSTDEENQFEEFLNNVRGILNKLTTGENTKLFKTFLDLPINSEERIQNVVNLIFEKAIEDPIFPSTYATLCKKLCKLEVINRHGEKMEFVSLLIDKTEREFWKRAKQYSENWNFRKCSILEIKDYELKSGIYFGEQERKRYIGNIRFIGALFNVGILNAEIMHICIKVFLDNLDELSLECLCLLLTTVGEQLEHRNESFMALYRRTPRWDTVLRVPYTPFNSCFQRLTELLKKEVDSMQISSKVKFMLQDVIKLRQNNWIPKERNRRIDQKLYSSALLP